MNWEARLALSQDSFTPLYAQLGERLREILLELPDGFLMPSEKDLMTYSDVSRATVRKAVGDLAGEGLLVSIRGRGTFTAGKRVPTDLGRLLGFTDSMRALGLEPETRLLHLEIVPAHGEVAEGLRVERGTETLRIERLRLLKGKPCMIEKTYLVNSVVPGLMDEDLEGSLYKLLSERWGLFPARGQESLIAVNADRESSKLLGVSLGTALLSTLRKTETSDGRPLEYTFRQARGDVCLFNVDLSTSSVLSAQPLQWNVS